jgi:pimeloyl-ACP methyl ester carboxylesterase
MIRLATATAALALSCTLMTATAAQAPSTTTATYTHQTAPTRYIEVDGAKLAYRKFGKPGAVPLVFIQHFVGNLDGWDPAVIDGFARDREVILFDSAGVGGSSGEVATSIEATAKYAIDLLKALGVSRADLLGFSMGSFVAQEVAIEQPALVRSLILVGSAPRGGVAMGTLTPEFQAALGKKHAVADELLLDVFFTPSANSQAAGQAFLTRLRARQTDRDVEINDKVATGAVSGDCRLGCPAGTPQSVPSGNQATGARGRWQP